MNILPHANVAAPGPVVPRQFLTVLSKGDTTFRQGSGRLELATDIFTQSGPLAARVIVNRVWGWHFGKALVGTESDFGVQGDKPTHPELLDDLTARFIANGMVAEVAAPRNYAVGHLSSVQPSKERWDRGRCRQHAPVADEPAASRRGSLPG